MVLKSPPPTAPAEKIVVVDQVMESSSEAESESELDLSYDNAIEDLKSQVKILALLYFYISSSSHLP